MPPILHSDSLKRILIRGGTIRRNLARRVAEIQKLTADMQDPDISVVIRTKNDRRYIKTLLSDIAAQDFDGKVEVILVDTASTDGTDTYAKAHGAKVITISQKDFTYPKALNIGFAKARFPYVVTLVGHSALCTPYMFKALTYWSHQKDFGGMYSTPLINWNASFTERLGIGLDFARRFRKPVIMKKSVMGILGANCSIVSRVAWEACGGYDERYAAGGEEVSLSNSLLAGNKLIVREPLCTVHHSHGLGLLNNIRQIRHWHQISSKPLPFEERSLLRRRPDLN
jgi:rhamnosyltransferase